ncbi:MAG: BBP7 family outer membrane beta-barrel protein [Gemmata sp.]|nr:BBP7 family outer membrane beta-barrel protein [Gemmata sp.]
MSLSVGRWMGTNNIHGVEGNFYFLNSGTTYDAFIPGYVVSFPRSGGSVAAQILPYPPAFAPVVVGTFPFTLDTLFATVDVNYRRNMICTPHARLDLVVGYRYAYLGDELYLGDRFDDYNDYRHNRFTVANHFHGGQVGLAGEMRWEGWFVAGAAKIALGGTTPELTTTGVFAGAEGQVGNRFRRLGALDQDERTELAVLPTVNLQFGHQLGDRARLFVSYSLAYLSHVTRISNATRPGFSALNTNDFWVQSIGFGADFRF